MGIHREGNATIIITVLLLSFLVFAANNFLPLWGTYVLLTIAICFFLFIVSFFRNPSRTVQSTASNIINCPADGEIVCIEEVEEIEYFKDKRLLISIFMSPLNVHVNRNPVDGKVKFLKYHPGKYLPAWSPKASTENERTTVVYASKNGDLLMRQIAGALARRIVFYLKEGQDVRKGEEMGFIKFGSRVDLFLPLDAEPLVKIGQKVRGNVDVIAELKTK